jgi:NCS1 family nucleobase:cation symporter-1
LYQPHGRYHYIFGVNWRALIALAASITPCLPGLAYNVNPGVEIGGAVYLIQFNWYYGFVVAFVCYSVTSLLFPAKETLVPCMIETNDEATVESIEAEKGLGVVTANEKVSDQ